MLFPSISVLLSGVGITAIMMVANWLVWGLSYARNFRNAPGVIPSDDRSPISTPLHLVPAQGTDDGGFKRVA